MAPPRTDRDQRIDLIRGLALVTIFVNHVPDSAFGQLTSRNFGFSDAAEAFVLLAGTSAALAYGRDFHGTVGRAAVGRPWARAWILYLVHVMLSLAVLAVAAALLRFGGNPQMLLQDNIEALSHDPTGVLVGLPLLLHQFGYVNILPLYLILLLATPPAIWLALRRPGWLLAGSLGLWLLAGLTWTNFRTYPGGNGWFLNPLSWQLLFVTGLLLGLRLKAGARLVPLHPRLTALAAGYLALAFLWVRVPAIGDQGRALTGALYDLGVPALFVGFDKGYVQLPRLLHVLALAYLVSAFPGFRAAAPRFAVLTLMGRQALPVFAMGTLLAFALRAIWQLLADAGQPPGLALDAALITTGLALQLGLAWTREWFRAPPAPRMPQASAGLLRRRPA